MEFVKDHNTHTVVYRVEVEWWRRAGLSPSVERLRLCLQSIDECPGAGEHVCCVCLPDTPYGPSLLLGYRHHLYHLIGMSSDTRPHFTNYTSTPYPAETLYIPFVYKEIREIGLLQRNIFKTLFDAIVSHL